MDEIKHPTYLKYWPFFILEGYRGSQAHGTYVEGHPDSVDDVDLMAVSISPLEYYCGLKHFETQEIKDGKWDIVVYDIKKYISLLLKQNPNVCSLLWLPDRFYTRTSPWGQRLIDSRDIFVSKKAFNSFSGYAYSQLKRMTHFQAYEGYMGDKRKKLVDKYGYDTKNAAHLIRLLKMCIEFLNTGRFNVWREDAEEIKQIKFGGRALDSVQRQAEELFSKASDALKTSKLPAEPNYEAADKLLVNLIIEFNQVNSLEKC